MEIQKPVTQTLQYVGAGVLVIGAATAVLAAVVQFPVMIVLGLLGELPRGEYTLYYWVWAVLFVFCSAGILVRQLKEENQQSQ